MQIHGLIHYCDLRIMHYYEYTNTLLRIMQSILYIILRWGGGGGLRPTSVSRHHGWYTLLLLLLLLLYIYIYTLYTLHYNIYIYIYIHYIILYYIHCILIWMPRFTWERTCVRIRAPVFCGNPREQTGENDFRPNPTGILCCSYRNVRKSPETSGSLRNDVEINIHYSLQALLSLPQTFPFTGRKPLSLKGIALRGNRAARLGIRAH